MEIDYLSNLPDELKLSIFSYLDTFDIVRLEEVSRCFQHLTYDKALISAIRLYKDYRCTALHLRKIVLHKLRHEVITSLNVNCVYWVSRNELKKCLKLPKLKRLYVIDTKLGINDMIEFNLPHLDTLAITFSGKNFLLCLKLTFYKNLKYLYIHYDVEPQHLFIISVFIQQCCNIEELWMIDLSATATLSIGFISILEKVPRTVKNITISFHGSFSLVMLKNLGFDTQSFKTLKTKTHLCLDKSNNDDVVSLYDESFYEATNWKDYIVRLKCDFPFGINDARKLVFKKSTLEDILWEELNLSHQFSLCNTFYRCVLDSIILTPNAKNLKKLSINTCSGQSKCLEVEKPGTLEPLFKKGRKSLSTGSPEKSTLQEIIVNSPLLEELEIWDCEMVLRGLPKLSNNALSSIKNLQWLRKLTISGVPNYVSPKYLIDICQNCVNLTSLRISSPQLNANLNNYLCMSIPYAKSLKDLRYEHCDIPICRLVESFCEISPPVLERLVLKCNDISSFQVESFEKFLTQNPQLRFLYISIGNVAKKIVQTISRELRRLKSVEQIFIVDDGKSDLRYTNVPYIHRMEMVDFNTAVSTLDVFNGFVRCCVEA